MLGNDEKSDQAIQIILKIGKAVSLEENHKGLQVRQFVIPPIDWKATTCYKMSILSATKMSDPPAIRVKFTLAIKAFAGNKLLLMHPCHNQAVERHAKLVTKAATTVEGFPQRDWMIRQKIKSRHLIKCFESKKQFNV